MSLDVSERSTNETSIEPDQYTIKRKDTNFVGALYLKRDMTVIFGWITAAILITLSLVYIYNSVILSRLFFFDNKTFLVFMSLSFCALFPILLYVIEPQKIAMSPTKAKSPLNLTNATLFFRNQKPYKASEVIVNPIFAILVICIGSYGLPIMALGPDKFFDNNTAIFGVSPQTYILFLIAPCLILLYMAGRGKYLSYHIARLKTFDSSILYLRSFVTDDRNITRAAEWKISKINPLSIITNRGSTVENMLFNVARLFLINQIAVGQPGTVLPRMGFGRVFVDDKAWQEKVLSLVRECPMIIAAPYPTHWVEWELEQIVAAEKHHDTVFLFLDPAKRGEAIQQLARFCSDFTKLPEMRRSESQELIAAFYDQDNRPVVVYADPEDRLGPVDALLLALAVRRGRASFDEINAAGGRLWPRALVRRLALSATAMACVGALLVVAFLGDSDISDGIVPQAWRERFSTFVFAPTAGELAAETDLGVSYEMGKGQPQDYARAAYWYHRAAAQGNSSAENNLGALYTNGQGVPKDYDQAIFWYREAVAQNHPVAQRNLGALYLYGLGVQSDLGEARRLLTLSAQQDNADAQIFLGLLYLNGEGVAPDAAQAAEWFGKSAGQGNAIGQYYLGRLYAIGLGVPKDLGRSEQLLRSAAAQGNQDAIEALKTLNTEQ